MNGRFRVWYINKGKYEEDKTFMSEIGFLEKISETGELKKVSKETHIVEYSVGHRDSNSRIWYEGDWTIMDDWSIGILVYDDEMSCFGFNIYEGENINNYDEDILEFEPLYYCNLSIMAIEGNIHEREVR